MLGIVLWRFVWRGSDGIEKVSFFLRGRGFQETSENQIVQLSAGRMTLARVVLWKYYTGLVVVASARLNDARKHEPGLLWAGLWRLLVLHGRCVCIVPTTGVALNTYLYLPIQRIPPQCDFSTLPDT